MADRSLVSLLVKWYWQKRSVWDFHTVFRMKFEFSPFSTILLTIFWITGNYYLNQAFSLPILRFKAFYLGLFIS